MGIFDFFGNRKEELSENVAALEQKLQSLKQEFLSEEKRGKELKLRYSGDRFMSRPRYE